jgi:hypothetical protein
MFNKYVTLINCILSKYELECNHICLVESSVIF